MPFSEIVSYVYSMSQLQRWIYGRKKINSALTFLPLPVIHGIDIDILLIIFHTSIAALWRRTVCITRFDFSTAPSIARSIRKPCACPSPYHCVTSRISGVESAYEARGRRVSAVDTRVNDFVVSIREEWSIRSFKKGEHTYNMRALERRTVE